jgi:hypothetical protein
MQKWEGIHIVSGLPVLRTLGSMPGAVWPDWKGGGMPLRGLIYNCTINGREVGRYT